MRRLHGRIWRRLKPVMSVPSHQIRPASGSRTFRIVLPSVLLPQPDSPTMPRVSPFAISSETPLTA